MNIVPGLIANALKCARIKRLVRRRLSEILGHATRLNREHYEVCVEAAVRQLLATIVPCKAPRLTSTRYAVLGQVFAYLLVGRVIRLYADALPVGKAARIKQTLEDGAAALKKLFCDIVQNYDSEAARRAAEWLNAPLYWCTDATAHTPLFSRAKNVRLGRLVFHGGARAGRSGRPGGTSYIANSPQNVAVQARQDRDSCTGEPTEATTL